ncbi:hypothetical protein GC093_05580 [Paenibacillus sp. LMG 31456]|uniref:HTH marR-type domain-containing protein n=1 Tax=Paenibacillus foliorum TaxID=2654974 RepID=A0A972GTX6_9BACL|nr:hypothetical protein [Paenibacillus foliorum]NOU92700.1 hypothetical protein [Paenibacillus foliorum]
MDKLEKKQYLKRIPCDQDRRVTYAELIDKGKQLFDDIFPQHTANIHRMMNGLTLSQKQEAIDLLKKLGKGAHSYDNNITNN